MVADEHRIELDLDQVAADHRVGEAWDRYLAWVDGWIDLQHASGAEAVTAVYAELLAGRVDPRVGHICTLT